MAVPVILASEKSYNCYKCVNLDWLNTIYFVQFNFEYHESKMSTAIHKSVNFCIYISFIYIHFISFLIFFTFFLIAKRFKHLATVSLLS